MFKNKESQMCIEMEPELYKNFLAASEQVHQPAEQIVSDLIRAYLAQREEPNDETLAAMEAIERGEVNTYASAADFENVWLARTGSHADLFKA